jgi:hypothetical protein
MLFAHPFVHLSCLFCSKFHHRCVMPARSDKHMDQAVELVRCLPAMKPCAAPLPHCSQRLTVHSCLPCRSQCVESDYTPRQAYEAVKQLHARGEAVTQNIRKRAREARQKMDAQAPPAAAAGTRQPEKSKKPKASARWLRWRQRRRRRRVQGRRRRGRRRGGGGRRSRRPRTTRWCSPTTCRVRRRRQGGFRSGATRGLSPGSKCEHTMFAV